MVTKTKNTKIFINEHASNSEDVMGFPHHNLVKRQCFCNKMSETVYLIYLTSSQIIN